MATPKKRKPGRPKGKKSNPDYTQITGYVTVKTYRSMKVRCFELDLEISEVLQQLLDRWLEETKPPKS